MDFRENPAIYIQIAEYVCEHILLEKWPIGEKIISIRELAVKMQVNPITVQRAYDFLQQRGIIANKRGIGYFVENDAMERILSFRREQFIENELGFYTDDPDSFPDINFAWESPYLLTNSIVELDYFTTFNFENVIDRKSTRLNSSHRH